MCVRACLYIVPKFITLPKMVSVCSWLFRHGPRVFFFFFFLLKLFSLLFSRHLFFCSFNVILSAQSSKKQLGFRQSPPGLFVFHQVYLPPPPSPQTRADDLKSLLIYLLFLSLYTDWNARSKLTPPREKKKKNPLQVVARSRWAPGPIQAAAS